MSRRALVAGCIILLAASCKGDGIVGSSTINGVYTLRTVNGASLPYTTAGSGANKSEIVDDAITFFEGFTYAETGHTRATVNGTATTATFTQSGAFGVFGTSVTLTPNDGKPERRGLIDGNNLSLTDEGLRSIYRK